MFEEFTLIKNLLYKGAVAVFISLVTLMIVLFIYQYPIDRCLDNGGCWDYNAHKCRKNEPDAQRLCSQSQRTRR